ncbi:hypothetical protein ACDW_31520 [Acidovorax sp. DW039]|uniref:hypothetical protein n=1 Tax=Acidovorax sp. DW039 TaxID=3095606 RepID=UPI003092BCD8|nr:hypothetical protein ACDW_31520 [Acidovorax sp. DW039]
MDTGVLAAAGVACTAGLLPDAHDVHQALRRPFHLSPFVLALVAGRWAKGAAVGGPMRKLSILNENGSFYVFMRGDPAKSP